MRIYRIIFRCICKKHSFENYDVYLCKSGGALSIKQLTHRNKNLQITEIKAKPFQHEYDNDLFSFENEIDSFKIVFLWKQWRWTMHKKCFVQSMAAMKGLVKIAHQKDFDLSCS